MRKILFTTLLTSFISLDSQAEEMICYLYGGDLTHLVRLYAQESNEEGLNHSKCRAGDTLHVQTEKTYEDELSYDMRHMVALCRENSIQVFRYDDKRLDASCILETRNKLKKDAMDSNRKLPFD